jgi:hypothetical protein
VAAPDNAAYDMVERVARLMATQAAARRGKDKEAAKDFAAAAREDFETDARAVVIAAHAPTAGMIKAGDLARHRGFDVSKVYSTMLDAALSQDAIIPREQISDPQPTKDSVTTALQNRFGHRVPELAVEQVLLADEGVGIGTVRGAIAHRFATSIQSNAAGLAASSASEIKS